jgi:hypothetical protein
LAFFLSSVAEYFLKFSPFESEKFFYYAIYAKRVFEFLSKKENNFSYFQAIRIYSNIGLGFLLDYDFLQSDHYFNEAISIYCYLEKIGIINPDSGWAHICVGLSLSLKYYFEELPDRKLIFKYQSENEFTTGIKILRQFYPAGSVVFLAEYLLSVFNFLEKKEGGESIKNFCDNLQLKILLVESERFKNFPEKLINDIIWISGNFFTLMDKNPNKDQNLQSSLQNINVFLKSIKKV